MRTGVGSVGGSREPRARAVLLLRSRAWNCSGEPRRRESCGDRAEGGVLLEFCVQGVRPEAWFRFLGRWWQFGALPSFVGGIRGPHGPPVGVIAIKCEIVLEGFN